MITDNKTYINSSKRGIGTIFGTSEDFKNRANVELKYNSKTARKYKPVILKNEYTFEWENIGKFYFLEQTVD